MFYFLNSLSSSPSIPFPLVVTRETKNYKDMIKVEPVRVKFAFSPYKPKGIFHIEPVPQELHPHVPSLLSRWFARCIDGFVAVIIGTPISYVLALIFGKASVVIPLFSFASSILYSPLCLVYNDGQTIGKQLLGIKVYDMNDIDTPLTGDRVFSVAVYEMVWMSFFLLDWWWALLDQSGGHRTLSQAQCGTIVLKEGSEKEIKRK
jgi:uncharacterized RDD family membrane protein YckC